MDTPSGLDKLIQGLDTFIASVDESGLGPRDKETAQRARDLRSRLREFERDKVKTKIIKEEAHTRITMGPGGCPCCGK